LTGWVAVTGHPVLLNHENDKDALNRFSQDHIEFAPMSEEYGEPEWAGRISEYRKEDNAGNRRFVAVPIKSFVDSQKTIGVIRYTCPGSFPEVTGLDQGFLEGAARIISAIENLKREKIWNGRELLAQAVNRQFEFDGDFAEYLKFIAEYTMSEIASLYICLGQEPNTRLRLVDASGLSKPILALRQDKQLHDYSHSRTGLTWKLLQSHDFVRYHSVAEEAGWTGLNTSVFYEEALRKVGRPDFASLPQAEQRRLVEAYRIQLLGGSLRVRSGTGWELCGVLKVEFPRVFDADRMYGDDDIAFLGKCSDVLAQELHRYRQIYDGSWFKKAGPDKAEEFLRLISGLERLNLFKGLKDQWRVLASNYLNKNVAAIQAAAHNRELRLRKPSAGRNAKPGSAKRKTGRSTEPKSTKVGTDSKTNLKGVLTYIGKTVGTEILAELAKDTLRKVIPDGS